MQTLRYALFLLGRQMQDLWQADGIQSGSERAVDLIMYRVMA